MNLRSVPPLHHNFIESRNKIFSYGRVPNRYCIHSMGIEFESRKEIGDDDEWSVSIKSIRIEDFHFITVKRT